MRSTGVVGDNRADCEINTMRKILSYTRRAVDDFGMIDDGDKIAVGVSGGKDSLALMLAMKNLQRFYPKKFDLVAITLSMGYENMDFSEIAELCRQNDIEYVVEPTEIAKIVFDIRKEPNPCSLCAKMRRGALHDTAIKLGCNKVALGHHFDDVIETFFLCLFNEARISCFSPVTYLDRRKITLIRPFVYMPEKEIKRFAGANNIPVVFNPCPANGNTQRQYMKDLIAKLAYENKGLKDRIFHAVKNSDIKGWKTDV